jgi:hypothetical protein
VDGRAGGDGAAREGGLVTPADVEARALAIWQAREKGVNVYDLLQAIASDPAVPTELRVKAERLRLDAGELGRGLSAEHDRVRALRLPSATCQDAPAAEFGPTRPPPPVPPGAVAEPPTCEWEDSCGNAASYVSTAITGQKQVLCEKHAPRARARGDRQQRRWP